MKTKRAMYWSSSVVVAFALAGVIAAFALAPAPVADASRAVISVGIEL